jgi:hypothetical protein
MPEISTVKNALQTVVKKDRLLNAAFAGGKSLVVSVSRTFYAFWLQTTGLIYMCFADQKRLLIESAFTLICAYFTLQSFLKAKRTAKRK